MRLASRAGRSAGFSMIEVLVTVVITAIGLLGLAKMQAAALGNTHVARVRSLIALQAESLATMMQANRAYWAAATVPARVVMQGNAVTESGAGNPLNTPANCRDSACNPAQLAAADLQAWAAAMQARFPGYGAVLDCVNMAAPPVSCSVTVSWGEKYVAMHRNTALGAQAQTSVQRFTLHIQP
ncbi:hypothetical protein LMG23992_03312 [Cupriavidus laharis]|uniref:Type IV pilus modification protein PilV n=1 Tax=Cupriavidus laharis TaxID=151654 RepID=A0ABM8X9B1_9BURK|nr:type IV pilus modification protein PilV [Cupriavidus laharis]CAG9176564.1 hypothetical protein LMG23992_03312 [Cupriavidus laharis]